MLELVFGAPGLGVLYWLTKREEAEARDNEETELREENEGGK